MDLNAVFGVAIERPAIFVELLQLFAIAGERAMRRTFQARAHGGKWTVQPNGNAVFGEDMPVALVGERASAERDYHGTPMHDRVHALVDGFVFYSSEFGLAALIENLGDGSAFRGFDFLIYVGERPSELVREQTSDGGFAGCHESHQVDAWRTLELQNHFCGSPEARRAERLACGLCAIIGSEAIIVHMQEELLPLFPLQVVLFPRTPLPLHIFEERYKQMIAEVQRGKSEFGVVLAGEKGIVNTGCTATIEKVLKKYPDGRMDLVVVGRRRFEIILLNDEKSYLRGAVEFFDDDESEPISPEVRKRVLEAYNDIRSAESVEPELADPQLSFQLAQAVPDLDFRQILLATRSEADRMRHLAEFFPSYGAKKRQTDHVRIVAPKNGHSKLPPGI